MAPATLTSSDVRDPRTPVVIDARRTPVGTAGRGLAGADVTALAAAVLRAAADAPASRDLPVDEVVLGNCCGPGGDPARVAALAAGLGVQVPALTVDRQCGSGLEAVHQAAARIALGARQVLAGGVESASTAPLRARLQPDGSRQEYQRAPFAPAAFGDPEMGEAADQLARERRISRSRQDAYAARSHQLALAARIAGRYVRELVPVAGCSTDDRPRAGLDVDRLGRFRPAFGAGGTVTAGNSCGISDGAAVLTVVDEGTRRALRLPGLAVRAFASVGVDPRLPGLGPVPAVRAVLSATALTLPDIGAVEITEAFAAQVLACTDAWGLDPLGADADRICADGGAIALGHPWGASGALLVVRLFARMVHRDGPALGVATCAIGGGQGVALLVERVG